MLRYVLYRLVQAFFTLLAMSLLVFVLARISGDPLNTMLPLDATEEQRAELSRAWGLDEPVTSQYGLFLRNLASGRLGTSLLFNVDVSELLAKHLPATLRLSLGAIVLALVAGVALGVAAAARRGGRVDAAARGIAMLGQSMPPFVLGISLIAFVAVPTGVFPTSGDKTPAAVVLPAVTLAAFVLPGIVRFARLGMIESLGSGYVLSARALGLPEITIHWWYALRNAAIKIITYASVTFMMTLTGAVVIETVFGWPGVGRLAVQAVAARDYPLVQGAVLVFAAIYIIGNLIVDLLYGVLDPRVRRG